MIKEIYPQVKRILQGNKERTNNQVFLTMAQMSGCQDGTAICKAMWEDKLPFSFESVTRAIRKVREECPELRDKGYSKRVKNLEPQVRAEINEFHTQKIQQGALL